VFREVGVDPRGVEREPVGPAAIVGEEVAQVKVPHRLVVPSECLPGGAVRERLGHVVDAAGRPCRVS
jgi:hypothetical protein